MSNVRASQGWIAEVWIIMNESGQYVVAADEAKANQEWDDEDTDEGGEVRRMTLSVKIFD